jgi:hypothetical protein
VEREQISEHEIADVDVDEMPEVSEQSSRKNEKWGKFAKTNGGTMVE